MCAIVYQQLLKERDKKLQCQADPKRRPSYFPNSFFLEKLTVPKYNYAAVKRW